MAGWSSCGDHGAMPSEPGILIVDDDRAFRLLLRNLLQGAGLAVVGEAADGAEAVELAERLRPTAISMDLEMPVRDGVAATREICSRGSPTVVILSGSQSSEQVAAAMEAGARWHVAKRDVGDQLVPVLRALLHNPSEP
jgi:CheY-like chemotaxis protein